jgi:2-polyprenyl-6-methoxyphenol hydroxylase-like FAD-dependent oxidoreductase
VKRRVEIAGAGVAGLTTGLAFAQKGWRVRVHEQNSALRSPGEGIHLWENGLRVLNALGVLAPVICGVIPASRHERRNPDGKTFSSSHFGRDLRLYVPSHRSLVTALHDALVERLAGRSSSTHGRSAQSPAVGCISRTGAPCAPI